MKLPTLALSACLAVAACEPQNNPQQKEASEVKFSQYTMIPTKVDSLSGMQSLSAQMLERVLHAQQGAIIEIQVPTRESAANVLLTMYEGNITKDSVLMNELGELFMASLSKQESDTLISTQLFSTLQTKGFKKAKTKEDGAIIYERTCNEMCWKEKIKIANSDNGLAMYFVRVPHLDEDTPDGVEFVMPSVAEYKIIWNKSYKGKNDIECYAGKYVHDSSGGYDLGITSSKQCNLSHPEQIYFSKYRFEGTYSVDTDEDNVKMAEHLNIALAYPPSDEIPGIIKITYERASTQLDELLHRSRVPRLDGNKTIGNAEFESRMGLRTPGYVDTFFNPTDDSSWIGILLPKL